MSREISSNLSDPGETFDIESLSMSLNVKPLRCSRVPPLQLTGTKMMKAITVRGTNIFNLHRRKKFM